MRKEKDVIVNDEPYTVREISIGEVMPIMPRLQSGGDDAAQAQLDLMRLCIMQNGVPMGDKVEALGLSSYLKLAEEVMEVNGLSLGDEGKD